MAVGTLLIERSAEIDPVETKYNGIPLTWAMHYERARMTSILGRLGRKPGALARLGNVERLREVFAEEPALARAADDHGSLLFNLPDDEERATRLEATVDHIQSDVTEMKAAIRRVDEKVDAVKNSVNSLRAEMKDSLSALEAKMWKAINSLNVSRWVDRVWWLAIAGAILGVMARGFKWI